MADPSIPAEATKYLEILKTENACLLRPEMKNFIVCLNFHAQKFELLRISDSSCGTNTKISWNCERSALRSVISALTKGMGREDSG